MTPQPPQQPSSYLDQSGGEYLRSQLQAMQNGVYATMVSPDRTKAWDADQLALQRKINDLAHQSNSGVDPERITGTDEFEHLSLEQIRDLTYEIKPEMVQAVSEAWASISKALGDASKTLSDGLKATIAENWQGQAAGSAAQAIGQFVDTSTTVGQGAEMVGMKVAFAQRGSDEAYRMLGPVLAAAAPTGPPIQIPGLPAMGPATIPGASTSVIPQLAGTQNAEYQKEEARQAALQVLRNVYSPGIHGGDQGVPVLASVQQIANPVGPVPPGSITPTPPGPDTTKPGSSQPNTPNPGNQQSVPGNGQPTDTTPARNSGNQGTNPASYSAPQPNSSGLGTTTSTAGVGPGTGTGGSPSLAGLGGAGLGGPGGGGLGGPGGAGGATSSGGGPGSSVPGRLAPTTGVTPSAANASRAVAGTPGMSPGMMGHGGGRGASGEDKEGEHKSSDLLRGQHLEEWINDGKKVLPAFGVIGGEVPATRPSQDQPPTQQRPQLEPPFQGQPPTQQQLPQKPFQGQPPGQPPQQAFQGQPPGQPPQPAFQGQPPADHRPPEPPDRDRVQGEYR